MELLKEVQKFHMTKCKLAGYCNNSNIACPACEQYSRCMTNCIVKCMLGVCGIATTCCSPVKDAKKMLEIEAKKFEQEYEQVFQFESRRQYER